MEQARLTPADEELDVRKFARKSVRGTDMVNVGVCESDAADWRPKTSSRTKYAGRRSCKPGINESETIVFPDQEAIDHAETS